MIRRQKKRMLRGRKEGTQGLVLAVVREIGKQCPVGREPELLAGLNRFWPAMQNHPAAVSALMDGLKSRLTEVTAKGVRAGYIQEETQRER